MEVLKINKENIKESEVEVFVTRVKAFVITSKNKVWIATSNGGCQLPGGHREKGEKLEQTLIRELKEEMGIDIKNQNIRGPFFELRHYSTRHGKKRMSNVLYFLVNSDEVPDKNKTNFTQVEKDYNFSLTSVDFDKIKEYVSSFITLEQKHINNIIAEEVLRAYDRLKEYMAKIDG